MNCELHSLEQSTTVVVLRSQQLLIWQQPSLVSEIFLAHILTKEQWRFA
jgi:hypothetical protein